MNNSYNKNDELTFFSNLSSESWILISFWLSKFLMRTESPRVGVMAVVSFIFAGLKRGDSGILLI